VLERGGVGRAGGKGEISDDPVPGIRGDVAAGQVLATMLPQAGPEILVQGRFTAVEPTPIVMLAVE
jgi:hypothetical protein